jgi:ATP synthase protein I
MSAMSDEHRTPEDLKALRQRLEQVRRDRPQETAAGDKGDRGALNSALGVGLRIGLELIVAVAFGAGLGWLIDQGLGSRPWAMLVGVILGFAAGVVNVYRAMNGLGLAAGYRPAQQAPVEDDDEEDR